MTEFGVETIELDVPPLASAFGRRLHDAGVPVTPAGAVERPGRWPSSDPSAGRRLYHTARAVLVSDQASLPAFDRVFAEVFGGYPAASVTPEEVFTAPAEDHSAPPVGRPLDARSTLGGAGMAAASPGRTGEDDDEESLDVPVLEASDEERLAGKRFDALEPGELARLYELMTQLRLATPRRRTRRYRSGRRGDRVDLRRTLRSSLRTGGDPIRLHRRERRVVGRRLVLLCDISGSMERYARAYLQFLMTCAAGAGPDAEAFVFATRLTRLTRALSSRNPERAIQRAAAAAPDWSSGTRIGDALQTFNDRHGRRGMARGAVVVILSDGWERADPEKVGREMARLFAPGPSHRLGQPAGRGALVLPAGRRDGGCAAVLRRAGLRAQLRGARRGRRGHRRPGARAGPAGAAGAARRRARALGQRHARRRELGGDAERPRAEQGQHHPGMGHRRLTPSRSAASIPGAPGRQCRRIRRAARSRRSATSRSTTR